MELSLSLEEVKSLSKEFDVIPLFVEVLADTDTPLSLFLKLGDWGKYRALLESAEGGIKWGRFSFVALGSDLSFSFRDQEGDPFEAPKKFLEGLRAYRDPRLPRFWGGLVGYVAYDVVRFFEPVPIGKKDVINFPDMFFFLTELVLIHDNLSGKVKVVVPIFPKEGAEKEYQRAKEALQKALERVYEGCVYPKNYQDKEPELSLWKSNFTKKGFEEAVLKAKEYIARGDVIQVVLSQRFSRAFKGNAEDIYRVLRFLNPSPYMFYLDFGDFQVVGSSPEVLVRLEEGKDLTRPIAGTRGGTTWEGFVSPAQSR